MDNKAQLNTILNDLDQNLKNKKLYNYICSSIKELVNDNAIINFIQINELEIINNMGDRFYIKFTPSSNYFKEIKMQKIIWGGRCIEEKTITLKKNFIYVDEVFFNTYIDPDTLKTTKINSLRKTFIYYKNELIKENAIEYEINTENKNNFLKKEDIYILKESNTAILKSKTQCNDKIQPTEYLIGSHEYPPFNSRETNRSVFYSGYRKTTEEEFLNVYKKVIRIINKFDY